MTDFPAYEDVLGCQAALYEWAESYDTKDWERLSRIAAPTLRIDYRPFLGRLWEAMPRADFVAMASDPKVLGDPRLRTQHLVGGASRWARGAGDDEVTGFHQMRVAHQRYASSADEKGKEEEGKAAPEVVAARGHAHGRATVWYRRVDGVWKFAGIEPDIRWTEYEHDDIFAGGKEKFEG